MGRRYPQTTVPSQSPHHWTSICDWTNTLSLVLRRRASDAQTAWNWAIHPNLALHHERSRKLLGFYYIPVLISKVRSYSVFDWSRVQQELSRAVHLTAVCFYKYMHLCFLIMHRLVMIYRSCDLTCVWILKQSIKND